MTFPAGRGELTCSPVLLHRHTPIIEMGRVLLKVMPLVPCRPVPREPNSHSRSSFLGIVGMNQAMNR